MCCTVPRSYGVARTTSPSVDTFKFARAAAAPAAAAAAAAAAAPA